MSTKSENLKLTQPEISWLKKFIKEEMFAKREEEKEEQKVQKEEQKEKAFLQAILTGKFIRNKNNPKYICKKCGKIIVKSWTTAMQFPERKFRCKCENDKK